ncbi:MAG: prolyl aminopeptidase [Candidatus Aminicenantes bacterium]|nr:prolyl aminopeptidase [Candidatus Aminicenantes bacterium]
MLLACLIYAAGSTARGGVPRGQRTQLWPRIDPFHAGHLRVSDIHKIYYEQCGNPDGKAVFVLHGGPGGNINPYYRRFFNPEVFHIVLHDQRGAGQSRPLFELKENTTQNLVEDIERLRKHVKAEKIILFGGSWGSTLALAYAEAYPQNVSGMVLRGIFTATKEEIDHFYGGGVRPFFPEVYEKLEEAIGTKISPASILSKVTSKDKEKRLLYAKAWTGYETKLSDLDVSDNEVQGILNNPRFEALVVSIALIENHYMTNGCFLEEGQLLRDTKKIQDIPVVLVNGRYDMICPPINAYRLHKLLPKSRLAIVDRSGHSMANPYMQRELVRQMAGFESF